MRKTDYEYALDSVKNIPKIYLGQEVKTPIGKGIVVNIYMSHNGLYLSPDRSKVVVWFSTSCSKGGFVNREFNISELKLDYNRKEKLLKIKELFK